MSLLCLRNINSVALAQEQWQHLLCAEAELPTLLRGGSQRVFGRLRWAAAASACGRPGLRLVFATRRSSVRRALCSAASRAPPLPRLVLAAAVISRRCHEPLSIPAAASTLQQYRRASARAVRRRLRSPVCCSVRVSQHSLRRSSQPAQPVAATCSCLRRSYRPPPRPSAAALLPWFRCSSSMSECLLSSSSARTRVPSRWCRPRRLLVRLLPCAPP
eukprot:COSAG06_NODE_15728_length_1049_cov_80.169474_1_plen_216_part_10